MTIQANPFAVKLNGVNFPITGLLSPERTAVLPPKLVTGDYGIDNDPEISTWAIGDQRGGIGIEKMSPKGQENRCWWSTCNLDRKGHITLPRLATVYPNPILASPAIANYDMETTGGWTGGSRTSAQQHSGSVSLACPTNGATPGVAAYQDLTGWFPGMTYQVTAWVKVVGQGAWAGSGRLELDDGTQTVASATVSGVNTAWTQVSATITMAQNATRLRVQFWGTNQMNPGTGYNYWDDVSPTALLTSQPLYSTPVQKAYFNGVLYIGWADGSFAKLTTGALTYIRRFPVGITAMVPSLNNNLYIFLGDAVAYNYMNTSEVLAASNVMGTLACQWDSKLFKMDSSGNCWYSITPNSPTPTWTPTGGLTDLSVGSFKHLFVGFDSSGDSCMYCATTRGLRALDYASGVWLDTALSVGDHPNGGAGAGRWRDAAYVSAGLEVLKYDAPSASIESVGLNLDDGLPVEANGEIVAISADYIGRLFASVAADQMAGVQNSGLYAYDGAGWQNWWFSGSADESMGSIIVCNAENSYRVFFSAGGVLHSLPCPRGVNNPTVTGLAHASSGVHITPWFDAGWADSSKVALQVKLKRNFVGTGALSTGAFRITVKYRLDYSTTGIENTWTTLGTTVYADQGASAEVTLPFTLGAGVTFKAIQFRIEMSLGPAENTLSPDLEWFALQYRILPATISTNGGWGYHFTVDCTKDYDGKSPSQLVDALMTAAGKTTNVELAFRYDAGSTETYYGIVKTVVGATQTGQEKEGQYQVFVVVP